MKLREKIYDLVEPRRIDTHKARTYDSIMLLAVDLSILPLMFRTQYEIFWYFDLFSGVCFIVQGTLGRVPVPSKQYGKSSAKML